jgi:hypothetical protein
MPYTNAALDTQQAAILAQHAVLKTAIDGGVAGTILTARQTLGALVGRIPLLLFSDDGYAPPNRETELYDLVYQLGYAMAPAF